MSFEKCFRQHSSSHEWKRKNPDYTIDNMADFAEGLSMSISLLSPCSLSSYSLSPSLFVSSVAVTFSVSLFAIGYDATNRIAVRLQSEEGTRDSARIGKQANDQLYWQVFRVPVCETTHCIAGGRLAEMRSDKTKSKLSVNQWRRTRRSLQ